MKNFFKILKSCPLFAGIREEELENMLSCLNARITYFEKNQTIFEEGSIAQFVGVVLTGNVQIIRDDFYGNRSIVGQAEPGDIFGEVFACANMEKLPISVISSTGSHIMLLDCKRIITSCTNACHFHASLINNLLRVVAQKSMALNQKIELISKRTTREKLLTYLLSQAKRTGCNEFIIPFNRQELADFLEVERSAMSAEISKLCREGVIETKKSWFRVL